MSVEYFNTFTSLRFDGLPAGLLCFGAHYLRFVVIVRDCMYCSIEDLSVDVMGTSL